MPTKTTKAQAQAVLKAVEAKFATFLEFNPESGPTLEMNWQWTGSPKVAIHWEEGPYEWVFALEDVEVPGVFVEPVNHWSVGIYPA